jgi:hypothetical protein
MSGAKRPTGAKASAAAGKAKAGIFSRLREALRRARGEDEGVRDFIGIVEIDTGDPGFGVVVLRDHVAVLMAVDGTDYAYGSADLQQQIYESWQRAMVNAELSFECFVDFRPIAPTLPGGIVDTLRRTAEATYAREAQIDADIGTRTEADPWREGRMATMLREISEGAIEASIGAPVCSLRQYVVLRIATGMVERVPDPDDPDSGRSMYYPYRKGWKVWESPEFRYLSPDGRARWLVDRAKAIEKLRDEAMRFVNDADRVPGFNPRPVGALEMTQLVHLLWNGEGAYGDWLTDQAEIDRLRSADVIAARRGGSRDDGFEEGVK